jgi:hypothetical protein
MDALRALDKLDDGLRGLPFPPSLPLLPPALPLSRSPSAARLTARASGQALGIEKSSYQGMIDFDTSDDDEGGSMDDSREGPRQPG